MFSHIFYSFSKNWIIHQLQKKSKSMFAFFLRSVFISIYGFSQAFWLNLITMGTFFGINPWLKACFWFLMYITYSVLWCKLASSFTTFSIFILSDKDGKSFWNSYSFKILTINFKKIFFITFFIIVLRNLH